eukprot:PhF_6_TR5120/c1_g1_i2/m.7257/K06916/zapE; cell division protein ZapE
MRPSALYTSRASKGLIKSDTKQQHALQSCYDRLHTDLTTYAQTSRKSRTALSNIPGIYTFGGVGCGKTYCMDLFLDCIPQSVTRRRVHFHAFMLDTHKVIHDVKKHDKKTDGMKEVTQRMLGNAEVLCFDEMMVTDIADAMILKRLFNAFYDFGVCVVSTSNRPPDDLYENGLNRELFTPFISTIKKKCVLHNMDSKVDYRLTGTQGGTYFQPINDTQQEAFLAMYKTFCKGVAPKRAYVTAFGRPITIQSAVDGVCKFTFQELCGQERSAVDYEAIAQAYHTVFLEGVPMLSMNQSSEVRRFIVALDVFYQHNVKLVVLADAPPEKLKLEDDFDKTLDRH